jgi:hypothetical protein
MRRDLRWSIDFGHPNHGRIRFEKFVTNDLRWFIPIVTLSDEEQGKTMVMLCSIWSSQSHNKSAASKPHSLFARAVRLLHESGCIDLRKEFVHDIGLLIGGLEPQPIHFDVASVQGVNRENYEEVMNLPNAPAVVIRSCKGVTRIGVEKKSLSHVTGSAVKKGRFVEKGKKGGGEEVEVVGETEMMRMKEDGTSSRENLYIIQSRKGFKFRGDFNHAGMLPLTLDGEGQKAWNKATEILMPLVMSGEKLPLLFEDVFEKLCQVPGLDSVTRLHCMVMPRNRDFTIAPKYVGHIS